MRLSDLRGIPSVDRRMGWIEPTELIVAPAQAGAFNLRVPVSYTICVSGTMLQGLSGTGATEVVQALYFTDTCHIDKLQMGNRMRQLVVRYTRPFQRQEETQ
jgi:hypothetical protein